MNDYRIYEEIKRFIATLSLDSNTYERLIHAISEVLDI